MLLCKVFNHCIRRVLWVTVMITLISFALNSSGAVGQNTKMAFDEKKDVEAFKITIGDNAEQMVGAASDIDRRYRIKLFDDIFNIPITVLQSVNDLVQNLITRPGHAVTSASGFGRSLNIKKEEDSQV